jgi:hypothetical protein
MIHAVDRNPPQRTGVAGDETDSESESIRQRRPKRLARPEQTTRTLSGVDGLQTTRQDLRLTSFIATTIRKAGRLRCRYDRTSDSARIGTRPPPQAEASLLSASS